MTRKQNWEYLLADFIERRNVTPFLWGQNDCCMMGCDWIMLATVAEHDFAEDFRGKYKTAKGAAKMIAKAGARDVETLVEKYTCTGFPEQDLRLTQRGDLVTGMTDPKLGTALGVCCGPHVAFVGLGGLTYLNLLDCRRSWKL